MAFRSFLHLVVQSYFLRRILLLTLPMVMAARGTATEVATEKSATSATPNIIVVLADDLGYHDISCQGATKLHTPGIDRLAKEGIRLTDAHSASGGCCPSRYALMTGRYPWRRSSQTWVFPGGPLLIEPGRMTIASLVKQAGYTTGLVGKWHLGMGTREKPVKLQDELRPGPLEMGFDYFYGHVENERDVFLENHRVVPLVTGKPVARDKGGRRADERAARRANAENNASLLHHKAVAFIEEHKDERFFLYYAPNNVHVPLTPATRFRGTSQCGVYGDFVQELDWSVGEVLATLDRLHLAEKTLVIFTSDNGGRYELDAVKAGHRCNAPLIGQKGDAWEGGNRVPFVARWPGHILAGTVSDGLLCLTDMMATFAAITGQSLPADAGPDSFDAMPLLMGQPPGKTARKTLIVQSESASRQAKHFGKCDLWAVRQDNWLLVMGQGSGNTTGRKWKTPTAQRTQYEYYNVAELGFVNSDYTPEGKLKPGAPPMQLYDLTSDIGEASNVYGEHPDIVVRLKSLFDKLEKAGRSKQ